MSVDQQMHVGSLHRYPVKSMLGETVSVLDVGHGGVEGDRRLALIDDETGRVASAKQARLWRRLLTCSARTDDDGRVRVRLPDGTDVPADDAAFEPTMTSLLGRPVRVATQRTPGAIGVSTPRSTHRCSSWRRRRRANRSSTSLRCT